MIMRRRIANIRMNYGYSGSAEQCEEIEFSEIDYIDAQNPSEEATRFLRFCEVTTDLKCNLEDITTTEDEQARAELLSSNARCGWEVIEIALYSTSLVLIIAVFVTNLLLAIVISKHRTLRTPTNKIILNLAISDVIFAVSSIYSEVMNILQSTAEMHYNYEQLENIISVRSIKQLCLILDGPGLIYASMMASVLTLTCVATEKYIAIFHPFKYYSIVTNKCIITCMVVIWAFSIFMGLLPLVWNTFDGTCLMTEKTSYGYIILWASICMVCAVVMATMYARIFLAAHKQARAITARQSMFMSQPNSITENSPNLRRTLSKRVLKRQLTFDSKSIINAHSEIGIYTTKGHEQDLDKIPGSAKTQFNEAKETSCTRTNSGKFTSLRNGQVTKPSASNNDTPTFYLENSVASAKVNLRSEDTAPRKDLDTKTLRNDGESTTVLDEVKRKQTVDTDNNNKNFKLSTNTGHEQIDNADGTNNAINGVPSKTEIMASQNEIKISTSQSMGPTTVSEIRLKTRIKSSTSFGVPPRKAIRKVNTKASISSQKLFPPSIRAVKTIAVILGAFYICWLPLLIYILAFKNRYSNFTINVLVGIAFINSVLNPVIYGFKNKGIRIAVKRLFRCNSGRRNSGTVSLAYETAYSVNH